MSQYFPKPFNSDFGDSIKVKIDLSDYTTKADIKKTDYNTKITEIEGQIPDISNSATKTALSAVENKIPDATNLATKTALTTVENKLSDISNLATKTALTTVKNKIPDVSSLVKKQIITLELLRLILRCQTLMVKLLKMSLL